VDYASRGLLTAIAERQVLRPTEPFSPQSTECIAHYNRAALLHVFCGSWIKAEELSRRAIEVCQQQCVAAGTKGWAWLMINPYRNLGRLSWMRGNTQEALRVLREIYDFYMHEVPLCIHGSVIDPTGAERPEGSAVGDDGKSTAPYAYLEATFKTLSTAGLHEELLLLLADLEQTHSTTPATSFRCALLEIYARTYNALGKHEECLAALRDLRSLLSSDLFATLIEFRLEATVDTVTVARSIAELESRGFTSHRHLPYAALVGTVSYSIGDLATANRAVSAGLETARASGDEVWELRFLGYLARFAAARCERSLGDDLTHILQDLSLLATSTCHCLDRAMAYCDYADSVGDEQRSVAYYWSAVRALQDLRCTAAQRWLQFIGGRDTVSELPDNCDVPAIQVDSPLCEELYDRLMEQDLVK
jgi:tetratricopeptide (TPR) repeat protein